MAPGTTRSPRGRGIPSRSDGHKWA
jgi:hypothetical protein